MMASAFKRILIIADIEGSSGCWSYTASSFMTKDWVPACIGMSRDIDAVVRALFTAGAEEVTVKDFHRTGFNLLPELIDSRARIVPGYLRGPVPGIGDPGQAEALFLIGLHAASGSGGFLPHTFTSRVKRLTVNGHLMPEVAFFSASVAEFGIRPVFFSGCPPARFDAKMWRGHLAAAAADTMTDRNTSPYVPAGPFRAEIEMRDGVRVARRLAARWGLERSGAVLMVHADDFAQLYMAMIRLCYLTPMMERVLPVGLLLFNLRGRIGLSWVRREARHRGLL